MVIVLGVSGAGKSRLLNRIAGYDGLFFPEDQQGSWNSDDGDDVAESDQKSIATDQSKTFRPDGIF